MNQYGLDPAWYFSTLGLSWDAALNISNVQLDLVSNPDMMLMTEVASETELQQYHTVMLNPTTNIGN